MKPIRKTLAICTLAMTLTGGLTFAQDNHGSQHGNQQYVRHTEWKKGARMKPEDWNRGERIDYQRYHLHAPPRGYEWREVDGNYVLAAIATGLISSVIIASTVH